ncbi:MAG: DUF2945 domain-containing protein [Dokdonella sp.]
MSKKFKVGDHVRWNSEAGHVSGHIIKVHTSDTDYKGHTHHCSEDDPQYEIKSDKTDHVAMHKGGALKHVGS